MAIERSLTHLKDFRADTRASVVMQYALLVAVTALLTALAMQAYGTDVAARFEAINAALTKMESGTFRQ
jgi:Flp pilus assembly pilin Flp